MPPEARGCAAIERRTVAAYKPA